MTDPSSLPVVKYEPELSPVRAEAQRGCPYAELRFGSSALYQEESEGVIVTHDDVSDGTRLSYCSALGISDIRPCLIFPSKLTDPTFISTPAAEHCIARTLADKLSTLHTAISQVADGIARKPRESTKP